MFKNLLIKCCNLIGRDDIVEELKNANLIEDIVKNDIKNDIFKLISYYNYTVTSIFENYLKLEFYEKINSNYQSQIEYFFFTFRPIKIISVKDENMINQHFLVKPTFLQVNCPNKPYFVTYNYTPKEIKDLSDNIILPKIICEKTLCYGVVSEFLASKGKFEESEFFNNKFLFEIFKVKTRKERRLKSTFCLWLIPLLKVIIFMILI